MLTPRSDDMAKHFLLSFFVRAKKRGGPACNAGGFLGTSLPRQRSAFDIKEHWQRAWQLSILSRLISNHYCPTNYLTPTRLPARICASLRSFKCGDSAARPAAWFIIYLRVKKIPTPFGVGIFLTGSYLSSQAASSQVLSTYKGLTTVFGMGTGGSP